MKCIVKDCINQTHEGLFIGELCAPCHEFVTKGNGVYSQVYRNTQRQWVWLTDEDIEQEFGFIDELLRDCVHRTEAKVREKNT
jgi:hypothetical protein